MPNENVDTKFLLNVLNRVKRNANAGPFLQPVDPVALAIPDYPEKIKHPMDLSTIKNKIDTYNSNDEFLADMKLMFDNCYLYNGEESPVGQMGKELEKAFYKIYGNGPSVSVKTEKYDAEFQDPEPASRLKRTLKNSSNFVMPQEDFETANSILNELEKQKNKKFTWPFLHPVTDIEAPGYSSIIKKPMDMATLRNKLDNRMYPNLKSFVDDLNLIVSNCKLYNSENTEVYQLGLEFEKFYKKELNKKDNGPDAEIEELRMKISELMKRLITLEDAKRLEANTVVFDIEEREKIGRQILRLGREESDKVAEIIQRSCSSFSYVGTDEIQVNMLTLPDHVIEEIRDFMNHLELKVSVESHEDSE